MNEALSDRAGTARFAVFGPLAGNNAIADTAASGGDAGDDDRGADGAARRPGRRRRARPIVAKIDVEGHELQVLAGATGFLRANVGVLQIEAFRTVPELDALLAGLGYARIFRMKNDYYYSNLAEPAQRAAIQDILFEEVATALMRPQGRAPPPPHRDPRQPRARRAAALRRRPGHRREMRPPAPRG